MSSLSASASPSPSPSPSSAAAAYSNIFLLHASFFVLLAAAVTVSTTASVVPVPVDGSDHRPDVNTTTMVTNGSSVTTTSSSSSSAENFEMYVCFLCTGRHPLLIHHCPIYWDECHLNCWWDDADDPSTSTSTAAIPTEPSSSLKGEDCYVMKLYDSGRYVIVQRLSCKGIYSCFLTCGGGELADHQKQRVAATTVVPLPLPATTSWFLPSDLCNTELVVPPPPPPGGAR